jgi:hypothetical protein
MVNAYTFAKLEPRSTSRGKVMDHQNYWTRRVARRRVLGGAAAAGLGVAALALTGCGDDDNKPANTPGGASPSVGATGTPVAGGAADPSKVNKDGAYHARQTGPWASINPYKGLDSGLTWGFLILDPLFYTPADTGVRENFLAASVEQPDPSTSPSSSRTPSSTTSRP